MAGIDGFGCGVGCLHQGAVRCKAHRHAGHLPRHIAEIGHIHIVIHGIQADHQVADIQGRIQGASDAGVHQMGDPIKIAEHLHAQGGVDLADAALDHCHGLAVQGTFMEGGACMMGGVLIFQKGQESLYLLLHGADNTKLHSRFLLTWDRPCGPGRYFPASEHTGRPSNWPSADSYPDSCRNPWQWPRGHPPCNPG